MKIKKFTFNPFQENTYILYDDSNTAVIVDPGCSNTSEQEELVDFIEEMELVPKMLLNTHAHIDHVLGNNFVAQKYQLELALHSADLPILAAAPKLADAYGLTYEESPLPTIELIEGEELRFGTTVLKIIHVPGHAPGHVVFLNEVDKVIIGGDVLFKGSIGRTDLPGGNHEQLISHIKSKLFPLEAEIVVYPGHGPSTTIGEERAHNPFF